MRPPLEPAKPAMGGAFRRGAEPPLEALARRAFEPKAMTRERSDRSSEEPKATERLWR